MRTIQISTDVFAAVWKSQLEGETSENEILARLLKVSTVKANATVKSQIGYRDPRYGVEFPEGFAIFRNYLGKDYRAKATGGSLRLMETGDLYPSLNELSQAIGATAENAWNNWLFIAPSGERKAVTVLRDQTKIIRRKRAVQA